MAKKTKHYKYRSPGKKRVRIFLLVVCVVIVGLAISSLYLRKVYNNYLRPVSQSDSSVLVSIPIGSTLPKISDILKTANVIRASWAFEWYVRNDDYARTNLEAGTYILHPNQSVQQIVTQISDGKASGNLVVILPDQRIDQIEGALVNDGFRKNQVVSALSPNQYMSKYPMLSGLPQNATLEGFLYPDSFARDNTTTATTIVNDSLSEMQTKLNLSIVNGFSQQGLTIYQGVTLASMVEQEVSNDAVKPMVAQVFLSRLHNNMDLGSDVTAFYGAIIAGQTPSVNYDSIYNTRLHPGLPFGPISNVTESSLQAVAHPSNTSYLYFVTGDNGKTYFSATLDQHNQQVQQYCKVLCSSE